MADNKKEPLIPAPAVEEPPPSYEDAKAPPQAAAASSSPSIPMPKPPPPPAAAAFRPPPFPLDLPSLNSVRNKRVILASASPRRKQLLSQLGFPNLEIQPCTLPEDLPKTLSPFEYALRTAERKALHVYTSSIDDPTKGDPALLIAADTVVVAGPTGHIFEKPRSEAEHVKMLTALRDECPGGRHSVVTGVAVMAPLESARDPGYRLLTAVEETTVLFDRRVSDELLRAYVRTREGADKAGGYGIQGLGAVLVERIEGSWENVMGLPLGVTLRLIERCLDQHDDMEDEYRAMEEANEEDEPV